MMIHCAAYGKALGDTVTPAYDINEVTYDSVDNYKDLRQPF